MGFIPGAPSIRAVCVGQRVRSSTERGILNRYILVREGVSFIRGEGGKEPGLRRTFKTADGGQSIQGGHYEPSTPTKTSGAREHFILEITSG